MRSLFPILAAIVFASFFPAVPAQAQLLVYDLKLEKTGRSVNYTFFRGGFLVVDTAASTFGSVIVLSDPNTFNFYQAVNLVAGTYNTILDYSGRNHAVLFGATSGTSSSSDNAALQVLGDITSNRKVGGEMRANIAQKLRGYLLASGAEVRPSVGNGTTGNSTNATFEYGFAGFSQATASYQSDLTKRVNNAELDSAAALTLLESLLSGGGIPSPTPTPSPTPSTVTLDGF